MEIFRIPLRNILFLAVVMLMLPAPTLSSETDSSDHLAFLSLTSEPKSTLVYLNGEFRGRTPMLLGITPGKYRLELYKQGYQLYQDSIDIKQAEVLNCHIMLTKIGSEALPTSTQKYTKARAYISVRTDPDKATVYLNDRRIGLTPISNTGAKLGEAKLKIIKDGYQPYEKHIELSPGRNEYGIHRLMPIQAGSSQAYSYTNLLFLAALPTFVVVAAAVSLVSLVRRRSKNSSNEVYTFRNPNTHLSQVGTHIVHPVLGGGVISAILGTPDRPQYHINFENHGNVTIVAESMKLKAIAASTVEDSKTSENQYSDPNLDEGKIDQYDKLTEDRLHCNDYEPHYSVFIPRQSVLKLRLLDLIEPIEPQDYDPLDELGQIPISQMDLSHQTMDCLRSFNIFPDDGLDALACCTLSYICSMLPEGKWGETLIDVWRKTACSNMPEFRISNIIELARSRRQSLPDLSSSECPADSSLRIMDLSESQVAILGQAGIAKISDLANRTEFDILKQTNAHMTVLKAFKLIYVLWGNLNQQKEALKNIAKSYGFRINDPPSEPFVQKLPLFSDDRVLVTLRGNLHPEYKEDVPIGRLSLPVRVKRSLSNKQVRTIGDVIWLTGSDLLSLENFGRTSLNHLREAVKSFILSPPKDILSNRGSLRSVIKEYIRLIIEDERTRDILHMRIGLQDGHENTLVEIAQKHNLSRERIHQIISGANDDLENTFNLTRLRPIFDQIESVLKANLGLCRLQSLCQELQRTYAWQEEPLPNQMIALINWIPQIDLRNRKVVVHEEFIDRLIKEMRNIILGVVSEHGDFMHILDLKALLEREIGSSSGNSELHASLMKINGATPDCNIRIPVEFLRSFFLIIDEPRIIKDKVFSIPYWTLTYSKTLVDAVEAVLRRIREPMHYSDIAAKLSEYNVNFREIDERRVYACLTAHSRFVNTARGVYSLKEWGHKKHVTTAQAIIALLERHGGELSATQIFRELSENSSYSESNIWQALYSHPQLVEVGDQIYDLLERQQKAGKSSSAQDLTIDGFDEDDIIEV